MKDTSQTDSLMGQRIRDLRKQRSMTLQDVADASGVAVSTLSKIERGKLAPTYDRFAKIAEALNVEVAALHSDTGARFEEGSFLVARAGDQVNYENDTYTTRFSLPTRSARACCPPCVRSNLWKR